MRKLITLFTILVAFGSHAQSVIAGVVKDNKGRPLGSATVAIKDSYDGGTTDSTGVFSFRTSEKGEKILVLTAIGYKPFEQKLTLDGTDQHMTVVMKEEVNEMTAVVITAGTFEASDKKRTTVLNSIDIVTTASANADVTAAIRTLPGAQQVGESEGLFVRGGTAAETRTYIDGTLVNNFFYSNVPNIAQRGRFSPFIFKGTVFSAGGYSALYGQALSAALILESIDLPDRSSGNIAISPIGGSAGIQKLNKKKNASWGVNYGYTNLQLAFDVLKMNTDYFVTPVYHTGDANFRIKTSKTGMLKYYGYFSWNKVGVRNKSLDSLGYYDAFRLENFNMYHNLSWKEVLGHGWKFNGGLSYANNKDDIQGSMQDEKHNDVLLNGLQFKNFWLDAVGNYFNGKAVFEKRLKGLSAFRTGGEWNYSKDDGVYTAYDNQQFDIHTRENLVAGFAEADVYLTNDIAAKFGGRVEHSQIIDKFNFTPRVSLAYKLGKESQASLAYGIFYQTPEKRYLPATTDLGFTKATHYIAQYQKVSAKQTLRVEAYYKKYDELLKTTVINNREAAFSNNGSGYARGFELFYRDKKTIKNVDYWISYSYLDTKRDYLNFPAEMEPNFAAKHTANLVVKKFVTKLKTQFNANYAWASGRPYYNIRFDNVNNKYSISDQGRLIAYNSLSFSVNYLPNIFKQGANKFTVFVFSVTNVLGSEQVYGYTYSYNGLRKEAIVPPTKTFIYLGVFISFGIDRSQDAINNNL